MLQYLRDLLPSSFGNKDEDSQQGKELIALANVFSDIEQAIESGENQYFVLKATWGLVYWEQELGLPSDFSKTIEERRSIIMSKLRSFGNGLPVIKKVAESFGNGEVAVTERFSEYTVVISFVGMYGVPSNLEDVKQALRNVIPAHLAVEFTFRYLLIKDIHMKFTIAQLNSTPLDQFAGGEPYAK